MCYRYYQFNLLNSFVNKNYEVYYFISNKDLSFI